MSDFWDYRGWERSEEDRDWQDIQGDNLEYRADALQNRALASGLDDDCIDKTINYLVAACEINREIGRLPELAECLIMLGDCYMRKQMGDEATAVAIEAEQVAFQSFNDTYRAKAMHLRGYGHYLRGEYDVAANYSMSAGRLHEQASNFDDAFRVYMAAGRLHRWRSPRETSIEAFESAQRVATYDANLENIVAAKTSKLLMQLRVSPLIDMREAKSTLDQLKDQLNLVKTNSPQPRQVEIASAWLNVYLDPNEAVRQFDAAIKTSLSWDEPAEAAELTFGRAMAHAKAGNLVAQIKDLRTVLSGIEDIASPVSLLDIVEPLSAIYFELNDHIEAESIWVRARDLAEYQGLGAEVLSHCDRMIALCIAEYAEPQRALDALECLLPKTIDTPLPFDFEFALAKAYANNDRRTESMIVIERALSSINSPEESKLEYAELHELKCELFAKQGNQSAARHEAELSFHAYFDLNEMNKAKRLKATYLMPMPGDANPETGAITLNWASSEASTSI